MTIMYFSGSMAHPHVVERLTSTNAYRLFTFAEPKGVHAYLNYCDLNNRKGRIMLDSGAFTAWNIGKPVQLQNLVDYDLDLIRRYPHHEFVFIALDVIPGERGRMATQVEISKAIAQSYANFLEMRQALPNCQVLPVYHSGEDKSLRDAYLDLTDYICLSPNQNLSEGQRFAWAREAYVAGYKFHGLATTGNRMLTGIDWYSVDSSACLMVAAMGHILFPIRNSLRPVLVSNISDGRKQYGKHLLTMPEAPWMREFIQSKGYDPDLLTTDYAARVCWNIDRWNEAPWQKNIIPPEGLFS